MSHVRYGWVLSPWMSHFHMNESCHTHCATHRPVCASESTRSWYLFCIFLVEQVKRMIGSTSYLSSFLSCWFNFFLVSHDSVTDMCVMIHSLLCLTWLTHVCDLTPSCVWHDSFVCVTWLIRACDMTHSCVWHDSCMCVTWLIHVWDLTHLFVWHDSLMCVTWLIRVCDMTHSYVWHDSFMCVTWLIQMCDMTHCCVWHESLMCVTWHIHVCNMTHSHDVFTCDTTHSCVRYWLVHMRHARLMCVTWRIHMSNMRSWHVTWHVHVCAITCSHATGLIDVCGMTRWCECHDSLIWVTWLIHVGIRTSAVALKQSHSHTVRSTGILLLMRVWLYILLTITQ